MYLADSLKNNNMKKVIVLFAIVIVGLSVSCKKDNPATPAASTPAPVVTPPSNSITINSTPQFSGTINGTSYSLVNGSTYTSGVASNKQIGSPSTASYASLVGNQNTNQPYFTINKGTMTFTGSMPDTASFDAFFPVTSIAFSKNNINGIDIDWIDPTGNLYSTSLGTANQSSSAFAITAKQVTTILGYQNVKVMATFSCTLYNSTGGSIALTNGIYVGYFEND